MALGQVRSMNQIGPADVAVGQVWRHVVTQAVHRHDYVVEAFNEDSVVVRGCDDPADCKIVSFGALLAYWVLLRESLSDASEATG